MMKFVMAFACLVLGTSSWAADGSSGCGPGWFVLKENSLVSSSLRATTNGILFPSTTIGMTMGTSNCTKHKIVQTEQESLHFVTNNYFDFKTDTSKGEGVYLTALAETIGCQKYSQDSFNALLKKNYSNVFGHHYSQPGEVLKEVYKIILEDKTLTESCSLS